MVNERLARISSNNTLAGISLLLIATVLFAVQDAITKKLTSDISVSQILLVRFAAFFVFALIYTSRSMPVASAFRTGVPVLQVTRSLVMCAEIGIFAYALRFLGVAEIHAIFSCFPLLITALSVPLLGESVGWRRWAAVLLGFCGTLIILQPGTGVFNPAALLALLCVCLYSTYNILTRKVSGVDRFETSLLYFGFVGFLASSLAGWGRWQAVDTATAILLAGIVVTSVSAHMLLIKSLQLAAPVILQPFNYFILVWAIVIGWLAFGEVLAAHELIGACIVAGSGIYVGYREYKLASV